MPPDVARGGPWSSQRWPGIISDLHGSQSSFTCVVVATLLTTTVSTPIWGKLADLADRKKLIQLALTITVLSSAAAGLSHNVETLITMRAFQGIGAGGLTALGTVLIAAIISPRERGKMMGLMGAVMGVAMVGGPLLGGVLTDRPGRQFSKSPARVTNRAQDRGASESWHVGARTVRAVLDDRYVMAHAPCTMHRTRSAPLTTPMGCDHYNAKPDSGYSLAA